MTLELQNIFLFTLSHSAIPGGFGGFISFLFAMKRGHYRNNMYLKKLSIEVMGAMITALFIAEIISSEEYRVLASFIIGIAWAGIVQAIRIKVTKIVEAALGEKLG